MRIFSSGSYQMELVLLETLKTVDIIVKPDMPSIETRRKSRKTTVILYREEGDLDCVIL